MLSNNQRNTCTFWHHSTTHVSEKDGTVTCDKVTVGDRMCQAGSILSVESNSNQNVESKVKNVESKT